ncbi:MAG: type II secretion system protein [Phycisphaeraceae bacterium]|nr:type II secretion system protein [Phycisphaeraceae bacterium]
MPSRSDRQAFTLIELLVVIGIVGVLIGIMFPVIGNVRFRARLQVCQMNVSQILPAFEMYLKENREIFPGGDWVYEDEAKNAQTTPITRWNLFGKEVEFAVLRQESTYIPQINRPLNAYLSDAKVTACPLDKGTTHLDKEIQKIGNPGRSNLTWADVTGTSYAYAYRSPDQVGQTSGADEANNVIENDIWWVGGKRKAQVKDPAKKLLICDAIYDLSLPLETSPDAGDLTENHWHNDAEPLQMTVGFMDGHVEQLGRKTDVSGVKWNAKLEDVDALLVPPASTDPPVSYY